MYTWVEARNQSRLSSSCLSPWLDNCHHQLSLASSSFSFSASCPDCLSYYKPQVYLVLPTQMYVVIIPWDMSNLPVAFFPKEYNFPFSDCSHQPLSASWYNVTNCLTLTPAAGLPPAMMDWVPLNRKPKSSLSPSSHFHWSVFISNRKRNKHR